MQYTQLARSQFINLSRLLYTGFPLANRWQHVKPRLDVKANAMTARGNVASQRENIIKQTVYGSILGNTVVTPFTSDQLV